MCKNYLIVSLSTNNFLSEKEISELRKVEGTTETVKVDDKIREYSFKDGNEKPIKTYGIQSNEATCKTILCETPIDTMFVVATEAVCENTSLNIKSSSEIKFVDIKEEICYNNGKANCVLDYFLSEIKYYCRAVLNEEERISKICVLYISDNATREELTNVATTIVKRKWEKGTGLYVDSQGGMRDYMIVLIGILRLARQRGILPKRVLYSLFDPRKSGLVEIVDKKEYYKIFDAVSGIDEFARFGRVYELINYFQNGREDTDPKWKDEPIRPVLEAVRKMSEAFATCFSDQMVQSAQEAVKQIGIFKEKENGNHVLQSYAVETIQEDLGDICTDPKNIVYLIEWCWKKDFIQQAATLYIEKLPEWYFTKEIFKKDAITEKYNSLSDVKPNGENPTDSELFYTGLFRVLDKTTWVRETITRYRKNRRDGEKIKTYHENLNNKLGEMCESLKKNGADANRCEDLAKTIEGQYNTDGTLKENHVVTDVFGKMKSLARDPNNCLPNNTADLIDKMLNANLIRYMCGLEDLTGEGKNATTEKKLDIINRINDTDFKNYEGYLGEGFANACKRMMGCNELSKEVPKRLQVLTLKKILALYVLMKQLRNNANHGGGDGNNVDREIKVRDDLNSILEEVNKELNGLKEAENRER